MIDTVKIISIVVVCNIFAGYFDAKGFVHAAKIWHQKQIIWPELGKSNCFFLLGMIMYWISLRFFEEIGISSAELQLITWFSVTVVVVAILSSNFFAWDKIDQAVAVVVLAGTGWLIVRTSQYN